MLRAIFRREFLEYLLSSKFLIGIIVAVTLMLASTVMNLANYRQRSQDSLDAQREMAGDRVTSSIFRSPQALSIFVQGLDRRLGTQMKVDSMRLPSRLSGYMGEYVSRNPRLSSLVESVDLAFVVRVVMSLMVIFLAYNAVSEEKSHGTLRLVLANPVPRDQFLLGKFLGGLFVILGSMLIATLLAIVVVLLSRSVTLSTQDWARIAGMLAVSALYLICFYTFSLFISVLVNRPSIALMLLLQFWIFLVVIYPNLGVVAAQNFYRIPDQEEVAKMKEAAFAPYAAEDKRISEEIHQTYMASKTPPKELTLRQGELISIRAQADYTIDQELNRRLGEQVTAARSIAMFSPAVLYDLAMARLARTDLGDYEKFMSGVLRIWQWHVDARKLLYTDRAAFRKAKAPPYSYTPENLAESYSAVVPWAGGLLVFATVFFVLAYVSFLKKDVR